MTNGQPPKDDFYLPPVTPGAPPPEGTNNTLIIVLIVLFIGMVFILPAVIAAFVFGMAGNISHTKVVAATVQQSGAGTMEIIFQGGQDAGLMVSMTVTVTDSSGQVQTKTIGSDTGTNPLGVGEKAVFNGAFAGKDHVVASGHFTDGTEQIILDASV